MKYAAFLRGIGPSNPNMHQRKLVGVLEQLGFKNVQAVISSGNVIFDSPSKNTKVLETKIEQAWPQQLGFNSTTIIRSQNQLKQLVKRDPFKGKQHGPQSSLNVTFLKKGGEVFNAIDTTSTKTPAIMAQLEKEHGKEITTRTWKTVQRVLAKMQDVIISWLWIMFLKRAIYTKAILMKRLSPSKKQLASKFHRNGGVNR